MEKKGFFESIKEFVWDILGYVLPGAYFIILLSLFVNSKYWINLNLIFESQFYPYVIIIISYLIGHVIYGLNILITKIFSKKSYTLKIENKIKTETNYILSLQILGGKTKIKGISYDFEKASFRDLRNIVMSCFPEQDQKIYTFTFRAEISNHVGIISFLIGTLGLVFFTINIFCSLDIFNLKNIDVFFYILLILSYFPLSLMRNRFYKISMYLPFSLYTSKFLNDYEKN